MPAAGPQGAPKGHQRPTRGRQGRRVRAPNVEYWRLDRLPAWCHCSYFRSNFKTVSLGTKEASMVTLTLFFSFFSLQFCNLAKLYVVCF